MNGVTLISSNVEGALAALRTAGKLWHDPEARIAILMPVVVRFPASLTECPISTELLAERLRAMAERECCEEVDVCVLLCRDAAEAVREALAPGSVVVVADARDRGLVRALRKAGHSIVFAEGR